MCLPPEEALGPEEQHQEEDDEVHHLGVAVGPGVGGELLGDAQDESAERRALHAPHASQHHDDERLEGVRAADGGVGPEDGEKKRTGDPGAGDAQTESDCATRSTRIPISGATVRFWATARMARPISVRRGTACKAMTRASDTAKD